MVGRVEGAAPTAGQAGEVRFVTNETDRGRVEAAKATVDDVSERAGQAYTRSNVAVTRAVDPIPSLLLVGAIGFLMGYVCSELRQH
jgi:hypothetical protein